MEITLNCVHCGNESSLRVIWRVPALGPVMELLALPVVLALHGFGARCGAGPTRPAAFDGLPKSRSRSSLLWLDGRVTIGNGFSVLVVLFSLGCVDVLS